MIMRDERTKKRIDYLKNFGFTGETSIVAPGINGKMDEVRAAYGLLELQKVDDCIAARQKVAQRYRQALRNVPGVTFWNDMPGVRHNYGYFPIFVNGNEYGMTRDQLYFKLREHNIWSRRYFYPLISNISTYCGLDSAALGNLPVANRMSQQVICLPIHHLLTEEQQARIVNIILEQQM